MCCQSVPRTCVDIQSITERPLWRRQVTQQSCFIMSLDISRSTTKHRNVNERGPGATHTSMPSLKQLCVWQCGELWQAHERDSLLIYEEWVADVICFSSGRGYESSIIRLESVTRYSTCRRRGTGALRPPRRNSSLQIRPWLHDLQTGFKWKTHQE